MGGPNQRQLRAQARIAAELGQIGFALPGSLASRSTACGKPGCRCQADPPVLHGPYLTWTRTVNGKTVTRKITEDQRARYQAWFDNARKLRQLVTDLEALSLTASELEGDNSSRRR
ncbi:MAG TPA: DUF6788 family protein [Acidimicrobiales bacterium]|jgi:hypothetical protein|nr:DUF6788 family protein [Acidimicrobiales bacterium]